MSYKYPLATTTWDDSEYCALNKVIESGQFTMGKYVSDFEMELSKYLSVNHCVMVNSGSSANLLMIAALFYTKNPLNKLKKGDEVIVPAVSWSTTYYPLYQYGLKIKFVDINLQTLNYDIEKLTNAISDNTRLIFAVNLLGNPNEFNLISEIIRDKNIILLEDNCESLGAEYNGKKAGTFGLMGSFSTFFSHHISTMEGGVIATNDSELYEILLCLRAHGWTRNLPSENLVCGKLGEDPFLESFRFVLPGYNVRPLEMSGALGLEQLKKLPKIVENRRVNAELFCEVMSKQNNIYIQHEVGRSSWFGFSMIVKPAYPKNRATLIADLNRLGFEVRPIVAGNFAKNDVVKYFNSEISENLSNADYLHENGLFIGNHHYSIKSAIESLKELNF